jgi:hypothetical protein
MIILVGLTYNFVSAQHGLLGVEGRLILILRRKESNARCCSRHNT